MARLKILFFLLAATTISNAVRINMQGSVSLGKQVLETLSHYMSKNTIHSRRSADSNLEIDQDAERIKWTVHSANLGRGLQICTGPLGDFIKEYVIILANAVESIFDGILTHKNDHDSVNKGTIFIDQLKVLLNEIQGVLSVANDKISEEKDSFEWIKVVKTISARFQKAAMDFVTDRLDGDPQDIHSIKKKLKQKLIIAIILVENKYENNLCNNHQVCEKEHECSKALSTLLGEFENTQNEKAKEFMKFFYENLPDQSFSFLPVGTWHEFQVILSDLSYTKNAPTRDVLLSVYKTVDARLKFLKNNVEMSKAYDQQLVHVILSDLDYFYYTKRKSYPFDNFLGPFTGWLRLGGKFNTQMRQVIKDIKKKLSESDPELVEKLGNEVRVFLELTVDPEYETNNSTNNY